LLVRAAVKPRLGVLRVEVDRPGAQVLAGDRLLGTAPFEPVAVPPGRYRLVVRKAGFREEMREVAVAPETTLELRVRLTALTPWYGKKRTWGIASLGLSAATTVLALWVGHTAQAHEDELRFVERAGALTERRYRELSSTAASRGRAANVLFGVAGAAAVTGIVLLLFDRSAPPDRAWQIAPGPAGAALAVRF
jgi:hypothetical protein